MTKLMFRSSVALAIASTSQVSLAASLTLSDSVAVTASGIVAEAANTGAPANGATFSFTARERQNAGQTAIRVATFLEFDTSTLTIADVTAPGFTSIFSINHVGHLNTLNTGFDLSVGRNTSGIWDSTTTLPSFGWAAASADQAVLLTNVHTVADAQGLSLDITPIVQGWVDGSIDNQGLVLFGTRAPANGGNNNFSQASFLDNAAINTSIPEPSSIALAGLGFLGFLARRRR